MGDLIYGHGVVIHPTAQVNVSERLVIGDHATISEGCVIEGRDITVGQEFYMGPRATIGGGSRFERQSSLRVGHYLHMGEGSFINTARPVTIGNEVGLGMGTKIFTHGAYLSALSGFPVSFAPVSIGNRVWLPGATVNPGVDIGDDVVVAVGSVVTKDIPSGSLAAGVPASVIREGAYPAEIDVARFWQSFLSDWKDLGMSTDEIRVDGSCLWVGETLFDPKLQTIRGRSSQFTEKLRDQLRRYGIRFYARPEGGWYARW